MGIHEYFGGAGVDIPALANYVDALEADDRINQVLDLSGHEQARLFEAAEGARPVVLDDFVPADTDPLVEIIHHGRNSLRVFHTFQKRFCRPLGDSSELWGYNEHGLRWLTGPGYFVGRPSGEGEILIDYLQVPPAKPAAWPAIRPNSVGGSRFVYYQTQDIVRGVSSHVSVGRATKRGKPRDNWFVLCRSGPA